MVVGKSQTRLTGDQYLQSLEKATLKRRHLSKDTEEKRGNKADTYVKKAPRKWNSSYREFLMMVYSSVTARE